MKAILIFALLITLSLAHHDDIEGTWNGSQLVSYSVSEHCANEVATCNFTCTFELSVVSCYRPLCISGNITLPSFSLTGAYVQNEDHTIAITESGSGEKICMSYSTSGHDMRYGFDVAEPATCPGTLEASCVQSGGNITSQVIAGVLTNPNFSAAETLQVSGLLVIFVALFALLL